VVDELRNSKLHSIWWSTKTGLEGEAHLPLRSARPPFCCLLPPACLEAPPVVPCLAGILIAMRKRVGRASSWLDGHSAALVAEENLSTRREKRDWRWSGVGPELAPRPLGDIARGHSPNIGLQGQ